MKILKQKTEIRYLIDIKLINMNKFLFSLIIVLAAATTTTVSFANAQEQTPPPLEKAATETSPIPTLGKITIQISQTEQIIIDLPLKSENKYQVVPIK